MEVRQPIKPEMGGPSLAMAKPLLRVAMWMEEDGCDDVCAAQQADRHTVKGFILLQAWDTAIAMHL